MYDRQEIKLLTPPNNKRNRKAWNQLRKLKPKLPRKIVNSAKLNLNRYWHKFEEFIINNANFDILQHTTKDNIDDEIDGYLLHTSMTQNNIRNELNELIGKQLVADNNQKRSSMYKHFEDDFLYHGVNLNIETVQKTVNKRCSCYLDSCPSNRHRYSFNHRNIQLSPEDRDNLENEALQQVYFNYGYLDTGF